MIKGLDLLVARRRQRVTAQAVASQMGTTRQYVSKLEAKDEVTPEAAEAYREALSALQADRREVTVEVDDYPHDYRVAGRQFRGRIRGDDAPNTLYVVVVRPASNWQAYAAIMDSIGLVGGRTKVVIAYDDDSPVVLKRVG